MGELDHPVWVGTAALRVGDHHLGVQANRTELLHTIRSVFAVHAVEDPATPPNFSLYAGDAPRGGTRPMYRLHRGCVHVCSSPSLARILGVLAGYLEEHVVREPPALPLLELAAMALVSERGAVLVPWYLRHQLPYLELRLRRSGVRVLEGTAVVVDTRDARLVVPPARLPAALPEPLEAAAVLSDRVAPGRLPLRAWILVDGSGSTTPAGAVAQGMSIAYRRNGAAANLEPLARLVGSLALATVPETAHVVAAARAALGVD